MIHETTGYHEEVTNRRRYALLQAAATIHAGILASGRTLAIELAVDDAEAILLEIDGRADERQTP